MKVSDYYKNKMEVGVLTVLALRYRLSAAFGGFRGGIGTHSQIPEIPETRTL